MANNLETADTIVKLVLAILVIVFYFTKVISGPPAWILLVLAILVGVIFALRMVLILVTRD